MLVLIQQPAATAGRYNLVRYILRMRDRDRQTIVVSILQLDVLFHVYFDLSAALHSTPLCGTFMATVVLKMKTASLCDAGSITMETVVRER